MDDPERDRANQDLRRGLLDPEGLFAERGFTVDCRYADGHWCADLQPGVAAYGRGSTQREAIENTVRSWMVEEKPPDLRRRRADPLP